MESEIRRKKVVGGEGGDAGALENSDPARTSVHWLSTATSSRRSKFLRSWSCPGKATPPFVIGAQRADCSAQAGVLAPRRADARAAARRASRRQLAQIQAEAHGRTIAAEHGADLVVAPAAQQRVGGPVA